MKCLIVKILQPNSGVSFNIYLHNQYYLSPEHEIVFFSQRPRLFVLEHLASFTDWLGAICIQSSPVPWSFGSPLIHIYDSSGRFLISLKDAPFIIIHSPSTSMSVAPRYMCGVLHSRKNVKACKVLFSRSKKCQQNIIV